MDEFTQDLLDNLFGDQKNRFPVTDTIREELRSRVEQCRQEQKTGPIINLFSRLRNLKNETGQSPDALSVSKDTLIELAQLHSSLDEHGVTVGGRLIRALPIVHEAVTRVDDYLKRHPVEAPSGIELWGTIQENIRRIQSTLNISDSDWNSYNGQIGNCIDSVEKLGKILDLPSYVLKDIGWVTEKYRMRLTPYYAALIQPGKPNDPVLIQSVPTGEMVDNMGIEIPPVAADHSPARLIDQFYPRVVTQINTAQEITPVSQEAFRQISKRVGAVLNQAVLLKGINDTFVKMWKLCETIQESYVRPYYVFNCSYRNPQFSHLRVPIAHGRDIIESMYGNISGDAIPRYIATAGGKIPLHRSNVVKQVGNTVILRKPWNNQEVDYPDADSEEYAGTGFSFSKYTL